MGYFGWSGAAAEAFGVAGVCLGEGDRALVADLLGGPEVDGGGGVPALLVDEPTFALDPHAEIAAFAGLWALAEEGDAVVLVTHRLAATANADRIYVLDQGRVAEEGTHLDFSPS